MTKPQVALLRQVSCDSVPYRDPLACVDWSALARGGRWLPEPALSLYGLAEYEALSEECKERLSRYELANALCCGLWLEALLLQRLARRIGPTLGRAEHECLLHELREEAGHSLMFLRAIEAGGLLLPERAWRAPRAAAAAARALPLESALFWLAVTIAEDVPDQFNRFVQGHAADVNPAVRQILAAHRADEARHIALARAELAARLERARWPRRAALGIAARLLLGEFVAVFYFPPARFYELAGLGRGERWRALALRNPQRRRFIARCLAPTRRLLERCGLPAYGLGSEARAA